MSGDDPHFYVYGEGGFIRKPSILNWELGEEGEDSHRIMQLNGWVKDSHFGEEDTHAGLEVIIYRPTDEDGRRLVELWHDESLIWTSLIYPAFWPKFYREEVLSTLSHGRLQQMTHEQKRIANAVIAVGNYATFGRTELDRYSGLSERDLEREREMLQARKKAAHGQG